jgi:hypothetical protein
VFIGVDFDNTIVSYDELFWQLAREADLVPPHTPVSKQKVRDHLRETGREDLWTELQGVGYGTRIGEARAFPGVIDFFRSARRAGIRIAIVSHKTRHPYRGAVVDLQEAARGWLDTHGFFDPAGIGLRDTEVFFEPSAAAKRARIALLGCTHFIDDLPEFLADPDFPPGVQRILFQPGNPRDVPDVAGALWHLASWAEIADTLVLPLEPQP